MLDSRLLEILVCPVSGGGLVHKRSSNELWCKESGLAYPIRDDVPIMLESEARTLDPNEWNTHTE
ncbi:MAG: Trm112 family protein [Gammaproteobacteria bacterium]|nr:Trm112 family protein [Gammaproteobacteria bacterium]MCY4276651.1 Trm112 family protein [Gammaproteobacteria bacterium]MCY4322233.1 Trm112 family protein [Gammaproteobacteria bacterium]